MNRERGGLDVVVVGPVGQRLGRRRRPSRTSALTGALALSLLLGKAMIGPLFSQSAWNNVTFTGGEIRDPAGPCRGAGPRLRDAWSGSTSWRTSPTS